jgi:4-hydroxy-3-polyprenylbenzoate decarboxylase
LKVSDPDKRIIVGISGASGVAYGLMMLKVLSDLGYEGHAVISKGARQIFELETDAAVAEVEASAAYVYDEDDLGAPISSGSFITGGMVVVPCSIKTLSGIAHSYNANLLVRAADVCLKERRPLILVVRETPLHLGHLNLMSTAASHGAVILPPIPAFYHRPQNIDDIILHTIGKILDCLKIPHDLYRRWEGA